MSGAGTGQAARRRAGLALASALLLAGAARAQQVASPAGGWVDPPPAASPTPPAAPTPPTPAPPSRSGDTTSSVDAPRPVPAAPEPPAPPQRPAPPTRQAAPSRPAEPEFARPERAERPPLPNLKVRPGQTETPRRAPPGDRLAVKEAMAQALAVEYLRFWSAPNAVALDATPSFYAPTIFFHGRGVTARALFEEKRRFAQRWPERRYRPRTDSMLVTCDPTGRLCTVRTVFDFTAISPDRGRRSQGTAVLMLGVNTAGTEPVIVSETSWVTARGRVSRSTPFEDD